MSEIHSNLILQAWRTYEIKTRHETLSFKEFIISALLRKPLPKFSTLSSDRREHSPKKWYKKEPPIRC